VQTTGQMRGHRRRVGNDWVVMMGSRRFALELTPIEGGCDIRHEGETYRLLSDWKLAT